MRDDETAKARAAERAAESARDRESAKESERDRRRHARNATAVDVSFAVAGAMVPVARVIDASTGGALLELPATAQPPALGAPGTAVLTRGDAVVERHARIVRIRWGGREKGQRVSPAIALVFDDADAELAARIESMLA